MVIVICVFISKVTYGQHHAMTYIKNIKSDKEIQAVYDSIGSTLFIINNSVYLMNAECMPPSLSDRHSGSENINQPSTRHSGNNDNSNNINENIRHSGNNDSDSQSTSIRHSGNSYGGEKSSERHSGSSDDDASKVNSIRHSGSSINLFCDVDEKNKRILLYIYGLRSDDRIKIFNNGFVDNKMYKIIAL